MFHILLIVLFGFKASSSLVLDPRFKPNVVKSRQFYSNTSYWYANSTHKHFIAYAIDDKFPAGHRDHIKDVFNRLASKTCLRPIMYFNDSACDNQVKCIHFRQLAEPASCHYSISQEFNWKLGYSWKRRIYLPRHCFTDSWVMHEVLHALGFGHEHARSDRDCYVEVTGPGLTDPQYYKDWEVDITFPYDVHSVMHYRRGDRIKPASFAWDQDEQFGSYDEELTDMDVIALNYMFCGGPHYCEVNPKRCQDFRCWIECNPCSNETVSQCKNCTGNTYELNSNLH